MKQQRKDLDRGGLFPGYCESVYALCVSVVVQRGHAAQDERICRIDGLRRRFCRMFPT